LTPTWRVSITSTRIPSSASRFAAVMAWCIINSVPMIVTPVPCRWTLPMGTG
jgi:hypothetical protein